MKSSSEHWDAVFSNGDDSKLGWYEKDAFQTFKLLNHIPQWEGATVFVPGAGTSVLIEELLGKGARLVLNDISNEALNKVKGRLGDKVNGINWLCQDISEPIHGAIPDIDVWIDRAVLHFLTDEEDIKGYFENVRAALKTGGYAMFAEFSKTGATECAGLTLHRYSLEELSERLGPSFKPISHFDHIYINPYGEPRPYVYVLYRREKPS